MAFAVAGLAGDEPGTKRERVFHAICNAHDDQMGLLVEHLCDGLREAFTVADLATLNRLRRALVPFALELDENFEIRQPVSSNLHVVTDIPALREHAARIHRAIRDDDDPQVLGSTKELLETTAKLVLERTGSTTPKKFPALLIAAFEALHLHPKAPPSAGTPLEGPVRDILNGALRITLGIDELRNSHGTGHGRTTPTALSRRNTRLAANAGVTVATFMLDTLDDPRAPWRQAQPT